MKRLKCVLVLLALAAMPLPAVQLQMIPTPPETKGALQFQKLDWGLNRILESGDAEVTAESLWYRLREGRIQVVIQVVEGTAPEVEEWLTERDSLFVVVVGDLVQAFVPRNALGELNEHPQVLYVRRPLYLQPDPDPPQGESLKIDALTEGLQAMNGGAWHSQGYRGQQMRVAVIDGGFQGMDALVGTELPTGDRIYPSAFGGTNFYSGEHGTACAEIVFDIVPEIDRMYLFAISTDVDFAQAINSAASEAVDVISASLGTLAWGPGDGTGVIANAINSFTASGGVFVSSAGNSGTSHWQGHWQDNDGDTYLDFDSLFTLVNLIDEVIPAGKTVSAQLVWNQWNSPQSDLDLYIVEWDGVNSPHEVAHSTNPQNGQAWQLPVEVALYQSTGAYYGVVVQFWDGPVPADIELMMRPDLPLENYVPAGSLLVPSDTTNAVAVAALDFHSPYNLESYSSRGPTNGPGGSLAGGSIKPDLAGYANVSTVTYGQGGFSGTSAACPHVAGAAALVWSAYPSWSATQVRNYLQSNAIDIPPAGKDNDTGFGRLRLGNPPSSCTYNISPTSASYGASGGNGSFSLTTQAGCTWNATSNNNWIHVTAGGSGTGNGSVSYSVDANGGSSSRTGTISAADKTFSITQAGATSCNYTISPTSASYGASGGNGSFSVTTQAGCTWTATPNNNWIHITGGGSGTGNGSVSYSVDANGSSSSRSGTITAAGRTFTITQSAAPSCTYSIAPTSRSLDQSGGTGTVLVNTTAGCAWTAVSNNGWIHVTTGASGTGSGAVDYSVDANAGSSRTGTMTIAGHTFTVTQSAGGGGETYTYQVAGIAHAGGAGGSVWRSTLCVTNRSGSSANLTLVYRMGSNTVTRSHTLQNNWIKEWADVAVSLFNQSANTSGAIEITSDAPVMVVARTYNEAPDGTFGQGMPGNDDSQTLASGQLGVLPQLKKTSAFRTNVGLMNHGSAACNVRIKLFSENGTQLGGAIDTNVPAKQWKQINDVFAEAGVGQCQIGYATVEVLTAGGRIWAYGSVVDNGTGDPTTISLFIE